MLPVLSGPLCKSCDDACVRMDPLPKLTLDGMYPCVCWGNHTGSVQQPVGDDAIEPQRAEIGPSGTGGVVRRPGYADAVSHEQPSATGMRVSFLFMPRGRGGCPCCSVRIFFCSTVCPPNWVFSFDRLLIHRTPLRRCGLPARQATSP